MVVVVKGRWRESRGVRGSSGLGAVARTAILIPGLDSAGWPLDRAHDSSSPSSSSWWYAGELPLCVCVWGHKARLY